MKGSDMNIWGEPPRRETIVSNSARVFNEEHVTDNTCCL